VRKEGTFAVLGLLTKCDRAEESGSEMYTGRFRASSAVNRGRQYRWLPGTKSLARCWF